MSSGAMFSSAIQKAVFLIGTTIMLAGCESYSKKSSKLQDTPGRGTIHISADESFKPVIDAQVMVYEANNPGTTIIVDYKPEAACLRDLLNDTVRMVIATRGVSEAEENFIVDSLRVGPQSIQVARDAIAVIVHPQAADSFFTMSELKAVLTGKSKSSLIPVFDGLQATSTVRFIVDSVLKDEKLRPDAMAAKSSEEVIDYVSRNKNALGLIGVSWIGNSEDSTQISFLQKVKTAWLESTDSAGAYVLPLQENIYMKSYPMVRDLVYTLKENHSGLGTGFGNFLKGEIGQLVFKRAYLVPARRNFILRPVRLRD